MARLGFDGVEFLLDVDGAWRAMLVAGGTPAPWASFRSVCAHVLTGVSAMRDQAAFDRALADGIDAASQLGANVIVVPFLESNAVASAVELEIVLRRWWRRGLLERAQGHDCVLAIESDLSACELIRAVGGHDRNVIGVCLDTGNARAAGRNPASEILDLGDRLAHVHLKDRSVNGPNVPVGAGGVDFDACFDALRRVGFTGAMVFETVVGDSPEATAADNLRFARSAVQEVLA